LLNLFYRRIWVRIAVILVIIVSIPVVALGVLLINTSEEAVRNSVLNGHRQIVARTAEEIELFIKRPQDILNAAAAMLGVVYPAPWKQETLLVELVLNQPIFMRVSSVDTSGQEMASSELGRSLSWNYPRDALKGVETGKTYISEVKILDNHIPYVTMAVPVKKMGKIVGVLVSDVNLRGIWDIVDNIRLGNTGRAFLVSRSGTLIAHQDKKRVLNNENFSSQKDVQAVLTGKTEAVQIESESGGKWISSYAPISGLGWSIVLRQKQDEAYLFSKIMKIQSWAIIILSELAAILASIFMARVLARPIKALALRIKRVAAGDLEHKIRYKRRDDIGELIQSFNQMTKKLIIAKERERLSAIGEAAAWITHELKNSLVSIKSFVQLFPERHMDEKFVDKFSKLIPEEINRWEHMLKELSDFSSHSQLRAAQTDVKKVMESILEIMEQDFIEKNIQLRYATQDVNFEIIGDPERLKQVFMNLIINAVNSMPAGGLLTISLGLAKDDRVPLSGIGLYNEESAPAYYIEVKVKDTGKGIPKDALNRLFEPFHTTKIGGMGLGLVISRRIIEQHKGGIEVESGIGTGTTFIVRLPKKAEAANGNLSINRQL